MGRVLLGLQPRPGAVPAAHRQRSAQPRGEPGGGRGGRRPGKSEGFRRLLRAFSSLCKAGALVSQMHTAAAAASGCALLRSYAAGTLALLAMTCTAAYRGSSLRAEHLNRAISAEPAQVLAAAVIMLWKAAGVLISAAPPQVSFVTNPIWVVKTRLELQRGVRSASAAAATAVQGAAASAGHNVRLFGCVPQMCCSVWLMACRAV